jgi:allantoinase
MQNLDDTYLSYPNRRLGMDHSRYDFASLQSRSDFSWRNGAKLGICVLLTAGFYPLNQQGKPFKVPGGMSTPYPDLRHFSLREYGHRVGIYRVLDALARSSVKPGFAISSDLIAHAPLLVQSLSERGEILGYGVNMDALHAGSLDEASERAMIQTAAEQLRQFSNQAVLGWMSPAKSQSANTPDLLVEQGFQYCCDWVNDELPYLQQTRSGPLIALPFSTELEDRFVLQQNLHSDESWRQQVCDAFDFLWQESHDTQQARLLTLTLHPWLIGQPHRIGALEAVLAHVERRAKSLCFMQPYEAAQHAFPAHASAKD